MKGRTYFRRWGFSINEGEIPNIHVSWSRNLGGFLFYVCWSRDGRWHFPKRNPRVVV